MSVSGLTPDGSCRQAPPPEDNALADARWTRDTWEWLMKQARNTP